MVRSRQVKGAGSAPTEGARRATGVGADAAAMGSGALAPGQRWSASRKRDVVLRLLRSEPLDAVSREVGVEVYRLERWKVRALAGLERGLKEQAGEPLAAELDAAKRHIGELSMDNELLRSRARAAERRLLGRPQFSWTRIKGESDVTRRWGYGSVEGGEGSWVGADGGSPEGDRSRRRRGGDGVGGLGAGTTVEREPETGCGVAAAAWRAARRGFA